MSETYGAENPPYRKLVRVRWNYDPTENNESILKINAGEIFSVAYQYKNGWWYGQKTDGSAGFLPSNFLEELDPKSKI
ncbi:hypothetical protein BT63DRAFT_456693 [Microthyrium microscopicum]|uniref:SH3 domain-containing protein n=1 Tax=Microthyrium microscopicum TaxID=703497 RepID=A0A6A6U922_9PEZI|nr:hypothetical protein BT63DRAFT_456693 [Microthyrium microscopicum]